MASLIGLEELKTVRALRAHKNRGIKTTENVEDETVSMPYKETEVMDFPLAVFPKNVRQFVEEIAGSIPCPVDFAAIPVLAVAGGLIGDKRVIEAKPGHQQYAQDWFGVIGNPGSGKTEPLKKVMQPVIDVQTENWDIFKLEQEQFDFKLAEWKSDKKNNSEPSAPKLKKSYVSDSTFEALIEAMQENKNLIAYWDEMSGWIKSMNQYRGGAGADKAHYLSMWSFSPVNVTRMTRDNYIPDPHLAIVGGIQPGVLAELRKEFSESDGFLHRILLCYPKKMFRRRSDTFLTNTAKKAWKDVCERLNALTKDEENNPIVMKFTDEAKKLYHSWEDDHFKEVNAPDFPDRFEGLWAKFETHMLRLALTIHVLRVVSGEAKDGEIDEVSILAAAELVDYFKSHAKKVYEQLSETAEDRKVRAVVKWLKKRDGEMGTHRDLQKSNVAGTKTAEEAKRLIDVIVKRGHAMSNTDERGTVTITLVSDTPPPDNPTNPTEW